MTLRVGLARVALAALALWLGLWPACDAITGAANTMLELSPPAAAAAPRCGAATDPLPGCSAAVSDPLPGCPGAAACGRMLETTRAGEACQGAGARCGAGPLTDKDAKPACAGERAARCGQCQCISGLVLFATAPPQFGPELALVGTLGAASFTRASRCPRPLQRPPMAGSLLSA